MPVSQQLVNFIKEQEGFKDIAYKPLPTDCWTIGYGSTYIDGNPVQTGDIITEQAAEDELTNDLNKVCKDVCLPGLPANVTQQQLDAVTSLCYNIGVGQFQRSTTGQLFYQGQDIRDRFALYNKSGGQVVAGLVNRRRKERAIYVDGDYNAP